MNIEESFFSGFAQPIPKKKIILHANNDNDLSMKSLGKISIKNPDEKYQVQVSNILQKLYGEDQC